MSSSDLNLTPDEQIIHHHAAMLKKELEAYHACTPRDENTWRHTFRAILVNPYYQSKISARLNILPDRINKQFL
jgi:hypothetical protein